MMNLKNNRLVKNLIKKNPVKIQQTLMWKSLMKEKKEKEKGIEFKKEKDIDNAILKSYFGFQTPSALIS